MKDTTLNSFLIVATLSAILFSAIGNLAPASQTAIQPAVQSVQASARVAQIVRMEKTVVTARRLAPQLQLAAVAAP